MLDLEFCVDVGRLKLHQLRADGDLEHRDRLNKRQLAWDDGGGEGEGDVTEGWNVENAGEGGISSQRAEGKGCGRRSGAVNLVEWWAHMNEQAIATFASRQCTASKRAAVHEGAVGALQAELWQWQWLLVSRARAVLARRRVLHLARASNVGGGDRGGNSGGGGSVGP